MHMPYYVLNCLFFIILSFSWSPSLIADQQSIDCSYDSSSSLNAFPENFFVESIDIDVNFDIDKDEIKHLIGIEDSTNCSQKDLKQALFYLRKKDCFKSIVLDVVDGAKGKKITFLLEGDLIFSYLKLHGTMVGKEKYHSCYLMDVGDRFDKKKHDYSLQKIKEMFFQQGFFNAQISDGVRYDKLMKTVGIDLFLTKGPQFIIGDVDFDLKSIGVVSAEDIYDIKKQLKRLFSGRLFSFKYSQGLLDESIQKLKHYLNRRGFAQSTVQLEETIDYTTKKVDLKFFVYFERKKEFVFWGNHYFSTLDFLENILMYGKSSWHFPGAILVDEIENMYKKKGFWDVNVSVKEEKNRIFCIIKEGKRASISQMILKDNFHIDSNEIKEKAFRYFLKTNFYDRDLFHQSIQRLKKIYAQHGFWDMAIAKEEFIIIPGTKKYSCVLTLDEGKLYHLKSISIPGYDDLLNIGPFDKVSGSEVIPFDYNIIHEQKSWILHHFQSLGHNKIIVDYELSKQDDGIDLIWKIQLDEKQVHFGNGIFFGNAQIPFRYLNREVAFEKGDPWSKKKLEKTVQNFRNLELFETVHLYPEKEIDENGYNPIGIKLVEADKYEMRTRIGAQQIGRDFSMQQGLSYKLGGTFIVNNPFNMGDRVAAEADFTRIYRNCSLQYFMPWVFNRPVRSHIKMYDNSYRQPLYIGSQYSLYVASQQGILLGLQERKNNIDIALTTGIEFMGIKKGDIDDIAVSIDYDENLLEEKRAYCFFEPTLVWNSLDNMINPCRGFRSFLSLKASADIADKTSFVKCMAEHAFYTPLIKKSTLAIRMRVGHVFNREFNQLIPLDRFYLGGANTVRGYDRDYCSPLGLLATPISVDGMGLVEDAKGLWRYVPQGGRTMINCNVEVRFPLYHSLDGVVFTDVGGLTKNSIMEAQNSILGGSGFGLRYNTPIGPLRFDFAWKWKNQFTDFSQSYAWYLTLGHAF